ncbi:hypothetical protein Taro_026527 [Colocasia esculenta]|uniref:Aminotransferase-like plant mobile domain-containing protein n=1 Tax=Colocasia esculenta TaxID=4460 RepID=A0A843VRK1_COLES|nr:hypothetical protein [Colocasia esculenta]
MRPRTMWPLVVAACRGLPAFQRERVREMGFGSILEIEPFFVDPPLIQFIRDKWDRVSRTFLFPWGHMVPSLEDVARITGLRVDGEAVTGVTYADYTDLTQQLLGLEPFGQDDHERRMVGRVALLQSLGLAGVRQKADELLPAFVEPAAGLARATYGPDAEDTVRADRDLRRFLVWSYYYLPLGRATEVDSTVVPLARRWLPLVSTVTYAFQLDALRRHVCDFPALLPYADYGDADQPWVVSGRGLFRRDIWVHYLNEIDPLRLRLAARTLGLHQRWIGEAELRGIGRKTRGKAKTVDWRTRFPEQFSDWHRGGQVVTSDATDSTAYFQRYQEEYGLRDFMRLERDGCDTLIGQLERQLAATTVQLAEARTALEILRTAQGAAVQAEVGGASSSRGSAVAAEMSSLQEQLAAAVAHAERAERDLAIRSEELESALARETLTVAELTGRGSQPTPTELPQELRIQVEGNLPAFDLNAGKIVGIDHVHGCARGGKGVSQEVLVTRNMDKDKLGEQLGVGRSVFLVWLELGISSATPNPSSTKGADCSYSISGNHKGYLMNSGIAKHALHLWARLAR